MELSILADLLYGPARVLNGAKLDDDELIRASHESFDGRPFCVVRHWMLLDIMVSVSTEHELNVEGLKPTILYSPLIVHDNQGKYRPGDSILSGYQREYDGCIFESNDTIFILGGPGARKHASVPAVQALAAY